MERFARYVSVSERIYMFKEKVSEFFCRVRKMFARRSVAEYFVLFLAISFVGYLVFYTVYGKASFVDVFFLRCDDLFMDFFNSVRDAAQGAGVYTERHVIYPPMANLLYLVCSRFIPSAYSDSSFDDRYSWTDYPEAIFFIMLFTLLAVLALFWLVYETVKGRRLVRVLFAFFAVVNVPLLYMVERGNMMLLCLVALMVYAATYNSPNKLYREIGLLALAFSFSLKLYPVIFGWLLLADKRFLDGVRCAVYGILMLIIPSFWFGGPSCFVQIFKNITSFSTGHTNAITVISGYTGISSSILSLAVYLWCFICIGAFIAAPFIYKERWKAWYVGVIVIMTVPSLTSIYMWSFFILPLTIMANTSKLRSKNWFYFILTTLLFMFSIFRFNHFLTINSFLMYPMTAVLSVVAVTDTVVSGVRRCKSARSKKAALAEAKETQEKVSDN